MNRDALESALALNLAHGAVTLKLDDELGTLHGLGFRDFVVLHLLSQAPDGTLPMKALMQPLGARMPAVVRQLMPLEKTGHVRRIAGNGGERCVQVTRAGQAIAMQARESADAVCSDAFGALAPGSNADMKHALSALSSNRALKL